MSKHETVSGIPRVSAGQVRQIAALLAQSVPLGMPSRMAQGWIGNKEAMERPIHEILLAEEPGVPDFESRVHTLAQWRSKFRGWRCGGCGKPLSGEIGFHPSGDGVRIRGFSKPQRIFGLCACGHETESNFPLGYRETAATFNPEFTVVRRAFAQVAPFLAATDPQKPAWLKELKSLLEPVRAALQDRAVVWGAGTTGDEWLFFELQKLVDKLRQISDEDIPEKYRPFRKFRHAFLAWCE